MVEVIRRALVGAAHHFWSVKGAVAEVLLAEHERLVALGAEQRAQWQARRKRAAAEGQVVSKLELEIASMVQEEVGVKVIARGTQALSKVRVAPTAGEPQARVVLHTSLEMQPRKRAGGVQSAHGLRSSHTPLDHSTRLLALAGSCAASSLAARASASAGWCFSQQACVRGLYTNVLHCAPPIVSKFGVYSRHERQQASAVG